MLGWAGAQAGFLDSRWHSYPGKLCSSEQMWIACSGDWLWAPMLGPFSGQANWAATTI